MKNLARIGCLARSLVYFLVGVMALLPGEYGTTTDESGVMRKILIKPFGNVMLAIIMAGLFCYAVWRFFQAIQDHDHYGKSATGLSIRAGFFFSGAAHAVLGFYALNLMVGFIRRTKLGERMMARWMMLQPFGRVVLWMIGFGVVVTGFLQFLRAFNGSFRRDLRFPRRSETLIVNVCRFGLVARGIVFAFIGSFLMQAAWRYRSKEAGGLQKAWQTLQVQEHGNILVAMVAVGFIAFAVFGFIEGFYRKRTG